MIRIDRRKVAPHRRPPLTEVSHSDCGCRKFSCVVLGDHVITCTAHSGVKKAHDWAVETHQVDKRRGQQCGDIELVTYLSNDVGPVSLVLDLCITHECWGSSSNPSLHVHSHYPTDIDSTLNEVAADKVLQYRVDYNNRPSHVILTTFITLSLSSYGVLLTD